MSTKVSWWGWIYLLAVWSTAQGQTASLLQREQPKGSYSDQHVSLVRMPPAATYGLHDLVTIEVDEQIRQQANALTNRRRQTSYEITFDDLVVLLSGLRLRADQSIRQERPSIDIEALNNLRTISQFNRVDRLSFRIQAEVMEIKPNGNLVLEAHGQVAVNNEVSTYKLSGTIHPRDINARTRAVPSSKVASKRVELVQVGPTRDSIKRGWFVRLVDMFTLF